MSRRKRQAQANWRLACALALLSGCGGKVAAETSEPFPNLGNGAPPANPGAYAPPAATARPRPPETCDDNPLLANCQNPLAPSPAPASAPPRPGVPDPAPEPRLSDNPLLKRTARIETILDEDCGSCHGTEGRKRCAAICDGMNYIDDMSLLIQSGKLTPCDWSGSLLTRRLLDGSMPPPPSGVPSMSRADTFAISAFVNGLCDDLAKEGSTDPEGIAVLNSLEDQCGACHNDSLLDAGAPPGGLGRISDVAGLTAGGFVAPCNSAGSRLYQVVAEGSMPPPGVDASGLANRVDSAALARFIDAPCRR